MVSRCFPGGYNVKLYISRGKLAWWLLAFLHSVWYIMHVKDLAIVAQDDITSLMMSKMYMHDITLQSLM